MALPNPTITPIPNNEPDAVPALWNVRYEEIDENFADLDQRATSTENEIDAARAGESSLGDTINAIIAQIGGISGTLSGLASPAAVQTAVGLDWLYRNRRIAFELFSAGYSLQNHLGVAVVSGIMGDDSIDIADTSGIKVGEDYLLADNANIELIRVTAVLSSARLRLASNLTKNWDAAAKITGSTLVARAGGGVDAAVGAQWVSRVINLGEDNTSRAVVIRRSLNAGNIRLYFRDSYTTEWAERFWSVRRSGGGTSGVPDGLADYEYILPMRGDGYIRIVVEDESMIINHIVALGGVTGLAGFINPLMSPDAPTVSSPSNGATNVTETPTITASGYVSPANNAFSAAQFQISTSNTFATLLHDSGDRQAMTYSMPPGVLAGNTTFYVRVRVKDVTGLVSDWSAITSFTTKATYSYVNTPAVTTPSNLQEEMPEQPTLMTAAFAVTGDSDTHASSRWQIRKESDSWATILHDSGVDTTNKTNYTVPAGVLSANTRYVLRVKHTGTTLGDSEWSTDITFTTKRQFAQMLGIVLTATGGGAGSWQRIDGDYNSIVTTQATFNNHAVYAGIIGQMIDGQAMVKVPKFYIKTGTVPSGLHTGKRYWLISDQPASGFTIHPAFKNAGNDIDQFWVGKYQGTDDGGTKLGSKAGVNPVVSQSLATFQTRANNRNSGGITGFMVWSVYQLAAIQTLALIEMGGADSQSLIGQGHVNGSSALATDHATVAQATWRGIIGLWGNVSQYIDGLRINASSKYEVWDKNGNKTFQTTAKTSPATGYPVTLATDSDTNYDLSMIFVPDTVGSAGNGTLGDSYNLSLGGTPVVMHGGFWSVGSGAGIFYLNAQSDPGIATTVNGTRIAKI